MLNHIPIWPIVMYISTKMFLIMITSSSPVSSPLVTALNYLATTIRIMIYLCLNSSTLILKCTSWVSGFILSTEGKCLWYNTTCFSRHYYHLGNCLPVDSSCNAFDPFTGARLICAGPIKTVQDGMCLIDQNYLLIAQIGNTESVTYALMSTLSALISIRWTDFLCLAEKVTSLMVLMESAFWK